MKWLSRKSVMISLSIVLALLIIFSIFFALKKPTHQQSADSTSSISHHSKSSSSISVSTSSTSSSTSSTSSSSSSDSSASSQTTEITTANWQSNKLQKLSTFMQSWQSGMKQSFDGTYDGKTPDYYGAKFPMVLTNGQFKGHILLDGVKTDVTWSPNTVNTSETDLVAVAAGDDGTQNIYNRILYFFIIQNGQPKVYVSHTTNGSDLSFTQTENTSLQNGFSDIANQ